MIKKWKSCIGQTPSSTERISCSKKTTLLPSAKCTRPLFQGRTGCSGRPSGWHDIVTCQRLVHHNNDVRQKSSGFEFWSCVVYAWPWCICPHNFAQIALSNSELFIFSEIQDGGRSPKSCTFGTFRHVNSVVFELYIKFGSNICDSHWDNTLML